MNKYEVKGIIMTLRECLQNNVIRATFPEDDKLHYNDGCFLCVKLSDIVDCIEKIERDYENEN